MKRWSIGINNFYYTSSIILDEAPWYVFALENFVQEICSWIPEITLPKIKITREGEKTNLRVWYGNTESLFHCFICEPITQWCFKKTKSNMFEFPYMLLKEKYPDIFKDLEYVGKDKDVKENTDANLEYSKSVGEEFNKSYQILKNISSVRHEATFGKMEKINENQG